MAEVKFGRRQIGKPMPAGLAFWARFYSAVAGILLVGLETAPFITQGMQAMFSWILGITIAIANIMPAYFGVQTSGESVPVDQVTSMETNKAE